ncbi:MAG: flagellar motor switch protein FliN [Phycisphaerales bacterium]
MSEEPNDQSADETTPEGDAQAQPDPEDAVNDAASAADDAAGEIESDGEMDDEAAEALAAAMAAVNSTKSAADEAVEAAMLEAMQSDPGAPSVAERERASSMPDMTGAAPMSLVDLAQSLGPQHRKDTLDLLSDVELHVRVELGRTRMYVEDILQLGNGAVVELDKLAGDPVDVFVNERHVARGEVLVLNDNFCIRVNEIIDSGAGQEA